MFFSDRKAAQARFNHIVSTWSRKTRNKSTLAEATRLADYYDLDTSKVADVPRWYDWPTHLFRGAGPEYHSQWISLLDSSDLYPEYKNRLVQMLAYSADAAVVSQFHLWNADPPTGVFPIAHYTLAAGWELSDDGRRWLVHPRLWGLDAKSSGAMMSNRMMSNRIWQEGSAWWNFLEDRPTIGGYPMWLDEPEYCICEDCGRRMMHVAQLPTRTHYVYMQQCLDCGTLAHITQSF